MRISSIRARNPEHDLGFLPEVADAKSPTTRELSCGFNAMPHLHLVGNVLNLGLTMVRVKLLLPDEERSQSAGHAERSSELRPIGG
jgi:hypothetical protein